MESGKESDPLDRELRINWEKTVETRAALCILVGAGLSVIRTIPDTEPAWRIARAIQVLLPDIIIDDDGEIL